MYSIKISSILAVFFLAVTIVSCDIKHRDIEFLNGNTTLRGTLYQPNGEGPFPAVVFVHGSGEETRKNSKYSAEWFASIGYVALSYDKRGVGESEGNDDDWYYFNFDTLANDVLAAVNYLKSLNIVDKQKVGLHATSQGCWVAPLAAAKSDRINFMILKSASVTTVAKDRIFERAKRLKREDFTEYQILEAQEMQLVEAKTDPGEMAQDEFTKLFTQNKGKAWFPRVYPAESPFTQPMIKYRKWYATVVDYDPVPFLESLDIPVFWIFGDPDLDHLGPVEKSLENLNSLKNEGKTYKIIQVKGQGHHIDEKSYEKELYQWLGDKTVF